MRGDGVGVGDVAQVSYRAWRKSNAPGGDDGRTCRRERDSGVVDRCRRTQCDAACESWRNRIDVDDGARGKYGAGDIHRMGT